MDSFRMAPAQGPIVPLPCCRCGQRHRCWDRIAGKAYCPGCQEALVTGEAEPLVERTEPRACAVCNDIGTVCYITFPLHRAAALEMDLCPEHVRCLLGRRLAPHAYHQLRRRLHQVKLDVDDVFLLHDAFYDEQGHALQPASDLEL